MGSLEYGAKQAVENCVKIKPDERVVIITDEATLEIAKALESAARKITNRIIFYVMEDFGSRPLSFPDEIRYSLEEADVSFYAALGVKKELQTFRKPMLKIVKKNTKLRHAHMIGITREIMEQGMSVDYEVVQKFSRSVYERVKNAREIRIITDKGTDITLEFSSRLKWNISDGNITAEDWSNLPNGEVYTSPVTVNGHLIIDGVLGDFFSRYGLLEDTPVELIIENGRVKDGSIYCENKELENELLDYVFNTDENSNRVGEFAFGTNIGLKGLIGNLLQDEKFPGIHIAFGNPFPEKTGADWDSDAHVDAVIKNPTVLVDGHKIMDSGKYLI